MVVDGLAAMVPHAKARGVRIGIEPLHPMYAADRSVVSTLGLANDMAERVGSDQVGVVIDVYHVWWDPQVYREIERSRGRIFGFHVCDWLVPTPHMLMGRGMMGDGVIEIARLRQAVEAQGYHGPDRVRDLQPGGLGHAHRRYHRADEADVPGLLLKEPMAHAPFGVWPFQPNRGADHRFLWSAGCVAARSAVSP